MQKNAKMIHKQALEFLKSRNTMVIASVLPDGFPHAATVYYAVDEEFNLYFMTWRGSKKCENLSTNDKIAFVIGTGPEVVTIQGGGSAEPLDEKEAQVFYKLIERIALRSPWQWPPVVAMEGKKGMGFCTFRIKPTWMVWLNLDKAHYPDIAQEKFYKLI